MSKECECQKNEMAKIVPGSACRQCNIDQFLLPCGCDPLKGPRCEECNRKTELYAKAAEALRKKLQPKYAGQEHFDNGLKNAEELGMDHEFIVYYHRARRSGNSDFESWWHATCEWDL